MSRILVLNKWMNMGGTEVALLGLLHQLIQHNHEVTLLLTQNTGPLSNQIPANVMVKELSINRGRIVSSLIGKKNGTLPTLLRIPRKIFTSFINQNNSKNNLYPFLLKKVECNENYDLLLDFYGYGDFLTAYGAQAVQAKQKATWVHTEEFRWINKVQNYFPEYDKIFCVSKAVAEKLQKCCPKLKDHIEVLYNFIDIEGIIEKSQLPYKQQEFTGSMRILTVGRLEEQKGIDLAIEAAAFLKKRNLDFHWYVIGEGSEKNALQKLIVEKGLGDCFTLFGLRENPYPYIKDCTIYVQPSRYEGYGLTLMEARVLCKPIVASDIPPFREQIQNGKNGYIVPLEPIKLADQIQMLMVDDEKRKILKKALETEKEKMDYLTGYEKIESMLR